MNKKGQIAIYALMLGVSIIILAIALAGPVRDFVQTAMSPTSGDTYGMDCSNANISLFDKIACNAIDLYQLWFIGSLILIGGAIITSKIIFG